jgi:thioredoxin 1
MIEKKEHITLIVTISVIIIIGAVFLFPILRSTDKRSAETAKTNSNLETITKEAEIAQPEAPRVNDSWNATEKTKTMTASKIKVTFIELGSVKCIPCKMMQPVMKKVEEKYVEKVDVVFYDVWTDKDKSKGEEYRINAIPTQIFLDKNGNEYFRHTGFFPFEEVEKIIKMKL